MTVAHFVPSVLSLFLDFVTPGDLPHLRQISCTGEALLYSHREKLTKVSAEISPGHDERIAPAEDRLNHCLLTTAEARVAKPSQRALE